MPQVLIIDDSPTEAHVLRSMLEKHGYHVSTAGDGEEGIRAARKARPDIILMDVVMPGLNGFQATRKIKRDPDLGAIPILILSTKGQESDRIWGLRQGARGYLQKPVAEQELLASVKDILGV